MTNELTLFERRKKRAEWSRRNLEKAREKLQEKNKKSQEVK